MVFKNLAGKRFHRLNVLRYLAQIEGENYFEVRCDCGETFAVRGYCLTRGSTKSCGCLCSEVCTKRCTKHGNASGGKLSREYIAWMSAKARCYCKSNRSYKWYGARGVSMCASWRRSFSVFLKDMGECPDGFQLDRINPYGNYEPSNCRWASVLTNQNNRRKHRKLTLDGITLNASEWASKLNIPWPTVYWRMNQGWEPRRVLGL